VSESLLSVGLDVGTTTTQMILSRLWIENKASGFAVPELVIGKRQVLYRSPVYFTPLLGPDRVDGQGIRKIVTETYEQAGIHREEVDTGAVIITGETSRKENARAVVDALSDFAGDFVVATAGPDLESVLAAKGAGAVDFSTETGKSVLHMDIGGGTSNMAWIRDGKILSTGCLNVGGRLVKLDEKGRVTYVSPVTSELCKLKLGDKPTVSQLEGLAELLVQALEMAAGLREKTLLLERLMTKEAAVWSCPKVGERPVISFSGGVADCIGAEKDWLKYGDLGPILGKAIRRSSLCAGEYRLGQETIRATVIGAGCHSAQLSGATVFCQKVVLPIKNRPVVRLSGEEQVLPEEELAQCIRRRCAGFDTDVVVAMEGFTAPSYEQVKSLARAIVRGMEAQPILVALEQDMAKALGQAMALETPKDRACLCIDSVHLENGSYLDVGRPVGPALPVVVKTLVLQK